MAEDSWYEEITSLSPYVYKLHLLIYLFDVSFGASVSVAYGTALQKLFSLLDWLIDWLTDTLPRCWFRVYSWLQTMLLNNLTQFTTSVCHAYSATHFLASHCIRQLIIHFPSAISCADEYYGRAITPAIDLSTGVLAVYWCLLANWRIRDHWCLPIAIYQTCRSLLLNLLRVWLYTPRPVLKYVAEAIGRPVLSPVVPVQHKILH